jgi:hypothetical protein
VNEFGEALGTVWGQFGDTFFDVKGKNAGGDEFS